MKLDCHGKFFRVGESKHKLYLKAVKVGEADNSDQEIVDLACNAVWLTNPHATRLEFFARNEIAVVAQLGFEKCLRAIFRGEKKAFAHWLKDTKCLLEQIRAHESLLAYDLGAAPSATLFNYFGSTVLQKHFRLAVEQVKTIDSATPLTQSKSIETNFNTPFLDFETIYFPEPDIGELRETLALLQNQIGARPLVLHSGGADSRLLGEDEQAHEIDQQIRTSFMSGCAGFVLTSMRDRADSTAAQGLIEVQGERKKSFAVTKAAYAETPFPPYQKMPLISVVVCVYNGEDYIEECLRACSRLQYANFEVLIVDDGSTDRTAEIARKLAAEFNYRLISQPTNQGLSVARNVAIEAARGEIVAYLDADAMPDEDWLRYLSMTFLSYRYAVVGGPNLNPLSNTDISDCIDNAPGNAKIVFLGGELCDHVPGCNLAVRKSCLAYLGGFRPRYRAAGDDVDFCWRVIESGGSIGSSPGAMVWHYRRPTIAAYLKQQEGYGKAEAVLEGDWPARFNALGHQIEATKKYRHSQNKSLQKLALSQTVYASSSLSSFGLPLFTSMPEWLIASLIFAAMALPGLLHVQFAVFALPALAGIALWSAHVFQAAIGSQLRHDSVKARALVAYLHMVQPFARLKGRKRNGMSPWRSRCPGSYERPHRGCISIKLSDFGAYTLDEQLKHLDSMFNRNLIPASRIGEASGFQFQIEGGLGGGVRVAIDSDESNLTLKFWPYVGEFVSAALVILATASAIALLAQSWLLLLLFLCCSTFLAARAITHSGQALAAFKRLFAGKLQKSSLWKKFQAPRELCELPDSRAQSQYFFPPLSGGESSGRIESGQSPQDYSRTSQDAAVEDQPEPPLEAPPSSSRL